MGMAHWTVEECRYFVDVIVPQSKYANGDHDENALRKSFGDLAKQMQDAMDAIGVNKRKYTQSNMFQHYYQKVSVRAHRRNESDVNNTALSTANAPSPSAPGSSSYGGPSTSAAGKKRKKNLDETGIEADSNDEPLDKQIATTPPRKVQDKKSKDFVESSELKGEEVFPRPPNHVIYGQYGNLEWDTVEFCRVEEKAAKAAAIAINEKKKTARKYRVTNIKGKGKRKANVVATRREDEGEEPARSVRRSLLSKPRKQVRSDPSVDGEDADKAEGQRCQFNKFAHTTLTTHATSILRGSSALATSQYQSPYGNPTALLDEVAPSFGSNPAKYYPFDPETERSCLLQSMNRP